jgi:hypothetical protein
MQVVKWYSKRFSEVEGELKKKGGGVSPLRVAPFESPQAPASKAVDDQGEHVQDIRDAGAVDPRSPN